VIRGAADAGKLHHQHAGRDVAHPGRLRAIGGAEPEVAARGIVRVALEVAPVALRVGKSRTCFEQQHIEAARRQLHRDHGSAAAGAYNNDIAHDHFPSR
jgi:hypothetical protein